MASFTHLIDQRRLIGPGGSTVSGKIFFYYSDTSVPAPVFQDAGLTIPSPNPIEVGAGEIIPPIYLDRDVLYRRVIQYGDGSYDEQDPLGEIFTEGEVGMPVGSIVDFSGETAPEGFLFCYGQAVSRTTYDELFSVIGTTYGSGNGTTTFNLPDYRGRVGAGKDNMGGTSANRLNGSVSPASTALGSVGGVKEVVLTKDQMPAHNHTGTTSEDGEHDHFTVNVSDGSSNVTSSTSIATHGTAAGDSEYQIKGTSTTPTLGLTSDSGDHSHTFTTANTGNGVAHTNVQPTIIFNKIIKAEATSFISMLDWAVPAIAGKANSTALGVSSSANDMGSFPGSIIPSNVSAKQALSALESNAHQLDDKIDTVKNVDIANLAAELEVIAGLQADGGLGFETFAELDAETGSVVGARATVYDDPDSAKNGDYSWDGADWVYLGYSGALKYVKVNDAYAFAVTDAEGWITYAVPFVGSESQENLTNIAHVEEDSAFTVVDSEGWVLFDVPFGEETSTEDAVTTAIARPWMGGLTDTSIAFAADVEGNGPGIVEIEIATDQYFTDIVSSTPAKSARTTKKSARENWRSINQVVRGLTANTSYWARFIVDGRVSGDILTFKTAPTKGVATAYRFAAISCTSIFPGTASVVHEAIASFNPLFVVHGGDMQYTDIRVNDVTLQRLQNSRRYRDNPDVPKLTKKVPYFYHTDDHDTADNDPHWEKTYVSGATYEEIARNTRQAFRETVPIDPQLFPQIVVGEKNPDNMMETQQFDIGKVRHILLDTRSQMHRTNATFLGNDTFAPYWNQLAWLKTALVQAGTDGITRVFLHFPTGWSNGGEIGTYFTAERTAISDYIRDTAGIPPVSIITGDFHVLAADDGTNTDYATGGGLATGMIMSSAANQTTIPGTQPYTWLGVDTEESAVSGVRVQFFAIIDVLVNGEWVVKFYGDPYVGATPTLLGTYSLSDATASVKFSSSTMNATASSVAQLPIERTWLSRAGIPSVSWTTSNGQSGTATFKANSKKATIPVVTPASGSITVTISSPTNATLGATTVLTLTAI